MTFEDVQKYGKLISDEKKFQVYHYKQFYVIHEKKKGGNSYFLYESTLKQVLSTYIKERGIIL